MDPLLCSAISAVAVLYCACADLCFACSPSVVLHTSFHITCVHVCCVQHWDDSDIPELLGWMEEHLQEGIATLSSFERYKKELLAGQLTWAPMHESGAWLAAAVRDPFDAACNVLGKHKACAAGCLADGLWQRPCSHANAATAACLSTCHCVTHTTTSVVFLLHCRHILAGQLRKAC